MDATVHHVSACAVRIVQKIARTACRSYQEGTAKQALTRSSQRIIDCVQASSCRRSARAAAPIPPLMFLRNAGTKPALIEKRSFSCRVLVVSCSASCKSARARSTLRLASPDLRCPGTMIDSEAQRNVGGVHLPHGPAQPLPAGQTPVPVSVGGRRLVTAHRCSKLWRSCCMRALIQGAKDARPR